MTQLRPQTGKVLRGASGHSISQLQIGKARITETDPLEALQEIGMLLEDADYPNVSTVVDSEGYRVIRFAGGSHHVMFEFFGRRA